MAFVIVRGGMEGKSSKEKAELDYLKKQGFNIIMKPDPKNGTDTH